MISFRPGLGKDRYYSITKSEYPPYAHDKYSNRWPIPASELRQRIEDLSASAPRFLFRAWGAKSGGMLTSLGLVFNEPPTVIRPMRFNHPNVTSPPKSIHDIPRNELADMCELHLAKAYVKDGTVFSSWSHDIQTCIKFYCCGQATHLTIIDTKMLPAENVVLYSPRLRHIVGRCITDRYQDEFLIFGVIQGDGILSCARFEDIERSGFQSLLPLVRGRAGLLEYPDDLDNHLWYPEKNPLSAVYGREAWPLGHEPADYDYYFDIALRIGRLYDKQFTLPVAFAFLCLAPWPFEPVHSMPPQEYLDLIPKAWLRDRLTVDPTFQFQSIELTDPWKMAICLTQSLVKTVHDSP